MIRNHKPAVIDDFEKLHPRCVPLLLLIPQIIGTTVLGLCVGVHPFEEGICLKCCVEDVDKGRQVHVFGGKKLVWHFDVCYGGRRSGLGGIQVELCELAEFFLRDRICSESLLIPFVAKRRRVDPLYNPVTTMSSCQHNRAVLLLPVSNIFVLAAECKGAKAAV